MLLRFCGEWVVPFPLFTLLLFFPFTVGAIEPYPGSWESGGVSLSSGKVIYSSPVVYELDDNPDNGKEIVVATSNGWLHALHTDGSVMWEAPLPNANCNSAGDTNKTLSSPSVGELYGDGIPHVVIGYGGVGDKSCGGGVVAVSGRTGQQTWHFDLKKYNNKENYWSFAYTVFSTPALYDTDRDTRLEVGFGSFDRRAYLLPYNGKKPIWSYIAGDTIWSSPAFAFIGKEATASMFMGTDISRNDAMRPPTPNGGYFYRFRTAQASGESKRCKRARKKRRLKRIKKACRASKKTKTTKYGFRDPDAYSWRQEFNQVVYSAPVVAPLLDSSEGPEIVTGLGCFFPQDSRDKRGKALKVLSSSSGKVLRTLDLPGCNESSPTIADLDGDGKYEIVATVNGSAAVGGSGNGWLVALNPDTGEELWRNEAGSDDYASFKYSAITGDLDGNGGEEVVVANGGSIRIFDGVTGELLTCDGTSCANGKARLKFGSSARNTPVISDLDGDGDLELIGASGGKVYVWDDFSDLKGSSPGGNPEYTTTWPMWRRSAQRTATIE